MGSWNIVTPRPQMIDRSLIKFFVFSFFFRIGKKIGQIFENKLLIVIKNDSN